MCDPTTVTPSAPVGMITLRGDLANTTLRAAVKNLTTIAVPDTGTITFAGDFAVAWMSPDELLILTPHSKAEDACATLSNSLDATHHLAANVSDARASFTLTGANAREVLARLSPADLSPAGFTQHQIRRTRLAQVPAAIWFSDTNEIRVVCFRSVADYVHDLLKNAAAPSAQIRYF